MMHSNSLEFVEIDPTGRYGRYNEVLGKGSSKTVYKAFDDFEGIEVAWNQVRLNEFLQSSSDLERLYCEIHLLKTLNHKNIMKFCSSWVDISKRKINFVTELFTSGTLRQYRQKHRRASIRALKHWCRQILSALLYLHSHDPPIIHRDLKCDNIFVNGNQGEVKIGDLGLAAILRKPHVDHCVGTPEFMAPEVYEEAYNELVDIYSFGMCVLEMVTFEYPYSECTHPAQIYKKVISGEKPKAFYKVKDPEIRQFVQKCLAKASERLSARELLCDPFLQTADHGRSFSEGCTLTMGQILKQPHNSSLSSSSITTTQLSSDDSNSDSMVENGSWEEFDANLEILIKGIRKYDGSIFLKLRIFDKQGHVKNIHFPFDLEQDTVSGVAAEMVSELRITDHDVTHIAEMIDCQISSLVPEWKQSFTSNPEVDLSSSSSQNGRLINKQKLCAIRGLSEERTHHINEAKSPDSHHPIRTINHSTIAELLNSKKFHHENSDDSKEGDHITSSLEIHIPQLDSADKSLKSFHLGRNFSYRIPSEEQLSPKPKKMVSFKSIFAKNRNNGGNHEAAKENFFGKRDYLRQLKYLLSN